MFYEVVIRDVVHSDIAELAEYCHRFYFDLEAVHKIYNQLYYAMATLNFMPNRFEVYQGEYRRMIVGGNYKVIYKVDDPNKKVIVLRVFRVESQGAEHLPY